ncbi:MAG: HEAT repeat domain-containing protein [Halanaerobiales bacterium]
MKKRKILYKCKILNIRIFLLLVLVLILGTFSTAEAEDKAELRIIVMFDETDVSLEAQVMLLHGYIPTMLNPGEEKSVSLEPGDYQMTVILPEKKQEVLPVQEIITLESAEKKEITFELQAMPGMSGDELPDMTGMMPENDEDEFDPEEATEAELREILDSEDEEERKAAFNELYARQKVPFLGEMLNHQLGEVRKLSLEKLSDLTTSECGAPTGPIDDNKAEIIECLQDPYLPARIKAIWIMGNYKEFPYEVLPTLIEYLEDPEVDVRYAAIRALDFGLGSEGKDREEVINALVGRVENDKEASIRRAAIYSLRRTTDSRVYKVLAAALADEDPKVRRTSSEVLSELGASASILKEITAALKDHDPYLRSNLLRALQKLDSAELQGVIPTIAELLEDEERYVRIEAIRVIRSAGPAGAEVLASLINALSDERTEVIQEVAWTIDALGPEHARKALPELLKWLTVESSEFGTLSNQADTIFAISEAIVTIGEPAIPGLTELLSHHLVETRARSAGILGRIGPAAESAVPKLTELLYDESEDDAVRDQAYHAIEHITGKKPEL